MYDMWYFGEPAKLCAYGLCLKCFQVLLVPKERFSLITLHPLVNYFKLVVLDITLMF